MHEQIEREFLTKQKEALGLLEESKRNILWAKANLKFAKSEKQKAKAQLRQAVHDRKEAYNRLQAEGLGLGQKENES